MSGKGPDIRWEDEDEGFDDKKAERAAEAEEFAALLETGEPARQRIVVGEKVKGIVSQFPEAGLDVLIDLGGKASGIVERQELLDEHGKPKVKVGDVIELFVLSRKGVEIILSHRMSQALRTVGDLEAAHQRKIPVRGKVTAVVKGGVEVTILGKTAFCPVSQLDARFVAEPGEYLGQELEFLIERIEEKGRNIVVTRAALIRAQAEKKVEEMMQGLAPDKVFDGVVKELRDFGAFVDIGGVEGMVHVSEISHARVAKPADALTRGDKVKVKVLKVDRDDKGRPKISLSIKAAAVDPWDRIADEIKLSETYTGKVVNLMNFGAFVEVKPGIEGLIHVSEMSWTKRVHHPSDVVKVGDLVTVTVKDIDPVTRRIALSMKQVEDDPWHDVEKKVPVGSVMKGKVERLKTFGAIIQFGEGGLTGLLPISALKRQFGEAYRQPATPGKDMDVQIVAVDRSERKILLSMPGLDEEASLEADYRAYVKANEAERKENAAKADDASKSGAGNARVGSFGALLGAKLGQPSGK